MKYGTNTIILLSLVIVCAQAARPFGSNNAGGRLGESCEYDDDCNVAYSYCRAQQTCECKKGYEPGPTRDRCVATIGSICSSYYDCSGLPNSECTQEVCSCRSGFVPHPSMKECLQVAPMYEASCTEHAQCTTAFGDRIECKDNKCQCIPTHHYVDGQCIQSKGLDQMCTSSKECRVSTTDPSKNDQVQCTAGRCQCIMGYSIASDRTTCTNAGDRNAALITFLGSLLLYVIGRILF